MTAEEMGFDLLSGLLVNRRQRRGPRCTHSVEVKDSHPVVCTIPKDFKVQADGSPEKKTEEEVRQ